MSTDSASRVARDLRPMDARSARAPASRPRRRFAAPVVAPLVLAALALAACQGKRALFRADRAKDQRAAGSVHVAVLAVAPWAHYASALQPEFQLDAEEALRTVVRDTSSGFESSSRSLGLGAGVTQDPETHGALPAPGTGARSQTLVAGAAPARPDAMLEYWAATALFQEVQLLNRALRDAAIPRGHRAYMVRLQLSLLPRRRNQPYDVYTTLSFFRPDARRDERGAESAAGAEAPVYEPLTTSLRAGSAARSSWLDGTGPCVLPLVVTDNLEASVQSRSSDDTRRLALAMLGFPGDLATEVEAQLFQSEVQAQVNARDINSLLTVARLSENSLRVRLGAMQQASARFAMVPRNHYVTVLLTVPEDAPAAVDLVAQTVLVDTETGEELAGTSEAGIAALLEDARFRTGLPALDDDALQRLLACVQRNDQAGYHRLLRARLGAEADPGLVHELWLELAQLMVGCQFGAQRFELPGHVPWSVQPEAFFAQTPLAVDDGLARTSLALHAAEFGERLELVAMLHLAVDGRDVTLAAESVAAGERVLRLAFPSLAALGLSEAAQAGLRLTVGWSAEEAEFDVLYASPGAPLPAR